MTRFFPSSYYVFCSSSLSSPWQGIDAEYVSLENVVPDCDGLDSGNGDEVLNQAFYDNVAFALRDRIEQCGNRIPVVTGP